MSDPRFGEPVEEENSTVDDVVGSANEGLADAEAASNDVDSSVDDGDLDSADVTDAPVTDSSVDDAPADDAPADDVPADDVPVTSAPDADAPDTTRERAVADTELSRYDTDDDSLSYLDAPTAAAPAAESDVDDDAPTTVAPAVDEGNATRIMPAPAEDLTPPPAETTPVADEPVATAPASQQPIFVTAPEPPLPRGNRGAAGLIGLLAAISFAVLYLLCALLFRAIAGETTMESFVDDLLTMVQSWWPWVTTAVFFIAFWLLGSIVNRGPWANWVVFGLFVGVASYGGHILGQLFQAPFWDLTASQGNEIVGSQLLAPLAIAAFVLGRELTIWFGSWVAARGRRMTVLNNEAQREYERTLEAGPRVRND